MSIGTFHIEFILACTIWFIVSFAVSICQSQNMLYCFYLLLKCSECLKYWSCIHFIPMTSCCWVTNYFYVKKFFFNIFLSLWKINLSEVPDLMPDGPSQEPGQAQGAKLSAFTVLFVWKRFHFMRKWREPVQSRNMKAIWWSVRIENLYIFVHALTF